MIKQRSGSDFNSHKLLKKYNADRILDYRHITRTKNNTINMKYIPQLFHGVVKFISYSSFQQKNVTFSYKLRKYVLSVIHGDIIAIGGESYMYSDNSIFFTNSTSCHSDAMYNGYKSTVIDYSKHKFIDLPCDRTIVMNLSNLNINLMNEVNCLSNHKLIIISCHHDDFWKKVKLLTSYTMTVRKRFIDYKSKYYITVNVFVKRNIVSLGGNCVVTYQLKKLNIRHVAMPFDWSAIKINKLCDALNTNFDRYDEVVIHKKSPAHYNSYTIKNKYQIFAHEVMREQSIDKFKSSLVKRVERFKNLTNPTFVRVETFGVKNPIQYRKYWLNIIQILNVMFKHYRIILISSINPDIDTIKWYNYNYVSDWQNNHLNWVDIFNS